MHFEYFIEDGDFSKAGNAASAFKKILKQLNVAPQLIKRIVVAFYEGEVNIVAHANGGKIDCFVDTQSVRLVLQDAGPGIPDIDKAMKEGFSTASAKVREMGFGAGMGLSNMKNNSDRMSIESVVGKGTKVELEVDLIN